MAIIAVSSPPFTRSRGWHGSCIREGESELERADSRKEYKLNNIIGGFSYDANEKITELVARYI